MYIRELKCLIEIVIFDVFNPAYFMDKRGSLRQGGCGSMEWFAFGIDPLLRYLEKRLQGILITSLPILGPSQVGEQVPLPPMEERLKLMPSVKT